MQPDAQAIGLHPPPPIAGMPRDHKGAVPLTGFQRDWVLDTARYKLAVKSRRIGFTFGTTLEIALDCVERRTKWLIISRTQDTAKEAIREVRNHLGVMALVAEHEAQILEVQTDLWFRDMRVTMFVIQMPNGSTIQALTAHPDAARGFGGNVFLDEFGFHAESHELWKGASAAIFRGDRLIVVSTPHYEQGYYFELARKAGMTMGHPPAERKQGIWSCHWVDVHLAAPQLRTIGVPVDLDELRELAGDEEGWLQEYCCAFLSSSEQWIPMELIAAARSRLATREWDPHCQVEGKLYAGIDIGRRKDRTVIWIDELIGDVAFCRGVITLEKTPFAIQERIAADVIAHPKMRRCRIDETGIGMQMAENLARKFGSRVEPVTFNLHTKEDMAVTVRRRFEEKLDKIPEDAPAVERAIAAIKREPTSSGKLRFDAARSEAGHADEFWAKALADTAQSSLTCAAPDVWIGEEMASASMGGY